MKPNFPNIIKTWPLFLPLLPVFFILHGYTENYGLVSISEALTLLGIYAGIAAGISLLIWLLYRNYIKAGLLTFFILFVQFFFGSFHDFLRATFPNSFITKYSILLPAIFIVLLLTGIFFKKSVKSYQKLAYFLNMLLIIITLADLANLVIKSINKKDQPQLSISGSLVPCDTCAKPDIYLILVDEYAGKEELKDIFSFNNNSFEAALIERGFHIVENSKANYNWTIYSMASLLNMNYIVGLKSNRENIYDNYYCADLINRNIFTKFLQQNGYEIFNYSFFNIGNKPRINNPNIVPSGKKLIMAQTLTHRLLKELGADFSSKAQIESILKHHFVCNAKTDSLTREFFQQQSVTRKFVYSHFMMPHPPYYFDSKGNKADYNTLLNESYYKSEKNAYIEYLQYTNQYLLTLIDQIRHSSKEPPVIILMSDHGFRQFEEDEKVDPKYYFMNLNAVLLPDGNYSGFYDGMSNVNQFRVILNTVLGQKLPLLKDSTHLIWDP